MLVLIVLLIKYKVKHKEQYVKIIDVIIYLIVKRPLPSSSYKNNTVQELQSISFQSSI